MNIFYELGKISGLKEIGYEVAAEHVDIMGIGERTLWGTEITITAKVTVSPDMLRELREQWREYLAGETLQS